MKPVHKYSVDAHVYTHNGTKYENGIIVALDEVRQDLTGNMMPYYWVRPNYAEPATMYLDVLLSEEALEENFYIGELDKHPSTKGVYPYESYPHVTYDDHKHMSENTWKFKEEENDREKKRRKLLNLLITYKIAFAIMAITNILLVAQLIIMLTDQMK